jgi:hypothetical protein
MVLAGAGAATAKATNKVPRSRYAAPLNLSMNDTRSSTCINGMSYWGHVAGFVAGCGDRPVASYERKDLAVTRREGPYWSTVASAIELMEALPADQAAPLWQTVLIQAVSFTRL